MVATPSEGSGRPVAARGAKGTIEYAVRGDGSCPARDFVEGLDLCHRVKVANLFQWLADHGEIKNGQKFKPLDMPIWEFKSHQIRMPCFQDGSAWGLTHGFIKKSDSAPHAEIDRAHRIHSEDQSRKRPPKAGK